jgi:hypothetical protein
MGADVLEPRRSSHRAARLTNTCDGSSASVADDGTAAEEVAEANPGSTSVRRPSALTFSSGTNLTANSSGESAWRDSFCIVANTLIAIK